MCLQNESIPFFRDRPCCLPASIVKEKPCLVLFADVVSPLNLVSHESRMAQSGCTFRSILLLHLPCRCTPGLCTSTSFKPFPCLSGLFKSSPDNPRKHINTHTLALDLTPRFVLRVCGNQNRLSIHLPPTCRSHELCQSLAFQVQPNA